MKTTKEQAKEFLKTLYNSTGQDVVAETLYKRILGYIEETGECSNVKNSKEYADLERQWFLADQLNRIYRNRMRQAMGFLDGRHDK